MTDVSRASNPTGPSLLDKSTAHPGSIDKSIFEKKTGAATGSSVGQGTVNSNYLRECREDNPEPPPPEGTKPQVVFSNCRFLTPLEELRIEEPFEMAVDLKRLGGAAICPTHFMLYSLVTKDGKEKRSYTWRGEGKAVDPQADPVVVKATGKLVSELGTKMQGRAIFELEAEHPYAKEKGRSPRVDVALQVVAHWMGGESILFPTSSAFPQLGLNGELIAILSTALRRVAKTAPASSPESVICFGFASSSGDADANRKLSLHRAQAVKALLDRDGDRWTDLAKERFGTSDIQQFMKDINSAASWPCHPGEVDGEAGPKTKEAILQLQKESNRRFKLGLKEDGICGPKTWSAVRATIEYLVEVEIADPVKGKATWKKPVWGNGGEGVFGNGEDFATGGDKPEERSVQITFFSAGAEQRLEQPKSGQKATIKENPVQDPTIVEKRRIPADTTDLPADWLPSF